MAELPSKESPSDHPPSTEAPKSQPRLDPTLPHAKNSEPLDRAQATAAPTAAEVEAKLADAAKEANEVEFQAENTIEVEGFVDDGDDPGYETDSASRASASLTSSITNYTYENGRRYHKYREGRYHFPNDETEQAREDMKHAMVLTLCGKRLHYAPLDNPQEVLDIGTGTGIWCIEFGDEYPSASSILGVDLSPIQPTWVPPNVRFMVDDVESPWLHGKNRFDFVHARHTSVAMKNMGQVVKEAYASIKPGGWLECQEMLMKCECDDDSMPDDYPVKLWLEHLKDALAPLGPDLLGVRNHVRFLQEAGFVNIQQKTLKIPIGIWPKNKTLKIVGAYCRMMLDDGLEGNTLAPFTKGLGWTIDQVHVFCTVVRQALASSAVHAYMPFHCTYGQKSLDAV